MKKILFILVVVLVVLTLGSCDLLNSLLGSGGLTIQERLNSFVLKINTEVWSTVYLDMHPDASSYTQAKEADFWSDAFPNDDYVITYAEPSSATDPVMTTKIVYTVSGVPAEDDIIITFRQDEENDSNWLILRIDRDGNELFRRIDL